MKHFYLFALFFTVTNFLHAQQDTTGQSSDDFSKTNTIETASFEPPLLVDAKHHILNRLADEKFSFRFGFEGLSYPSNDEFHSNLSIAHGVFANYEHRLATGLSLNARLNYHKFTHDVLFQKRSTYLGRNYYYVIHRFSFELEPRWYFLKRREIAQGKSGNNLDGIYVGSTIGVQHWQRPGAWRVMTLDGRNYWPYLKGNFQYTTLNLGWQRRFSEKGFLHLQLGAGVRHNKTFDFPNELLSPDSYFKQLPKWQSLMTYKVGVGIALGQKGNSQIAQSILEYQKEDWTMWKLDLIPIFLGTGSNKLVSKINIGYEQGLAKKPFSINTNFTYFLFSKYDYDVNNKYLTLQLSPRFYYTYGKKKFVNNLTGNYFSIRNQWNIISNWDYNKYAFALLWGNQRRLFSNMFINYELGYEFGDVFGNYFISDLKIGLAF